MTIDPRWLVPDPARPVFSLCIAFPRGSGTDLNGLAGLSYVTGQMALRGAGPFSRKAFLEAVDRLGASCDISVSRHHTLLWLDGLSRHFDAVVELAAVALATPHHDAGEFDKLVRELDVELDEVRDDDGALGARAFARSLYGDHPYGRPLRGSHGSLAALTLDHVKAHHGRLFAPADVMASLAGSLGQDALAGALTRIIPGVDLKTAMAGSIDADAFGCLAKKPGIHVTVVDKPDRTQTQLFIGQPTIPLGHPDWTALQLAQTAFGGMFTAPLSQEIREKRGWSYSVWSALQSDAWLGTFQIRLHPNAPDAAPALQLTLELLKNFQQQGPSDDDFGAAKSNLARSHVFGIDTASRLMWLRLNTELSGRPREWLDDAVARYEAVPFEDAVRSAAQHLDPTALTVVIVCTAATVLPALQALPGIASIEVIDWEFDLEDPTTIDE